jgi:hypothetical protein
MAELTILNWNPVENMKSIIEENLDQEMDRRFDHIKRFTCM